METKCGFHQRSLNRTEEIMVALAFAVSSALFLPPREYHIDCSGWTGANLAEFHLRFTARDGSIIKASIEIQPGTTPQDVRDALEAVIRDTGWRYRTVGKGLLIVEGAKKSAVRSVEFKSKDWKPDVRVTLVVPEKK